MHVDMISNVMYVMKHNKMNTINALCHIILI